MAVETSNRRRTAETGTNTGTGPGTSTDDELPDLRQPGRKPGGNAFVAFEPGGGQAEHGRAGEMTLPTQEEPE